MRKLFMTTAFILPLSFVQAYAQDTATPATDAPADATMTEAPADQVATETMIEETEVEADTAATEMAAAEKVSTEQGPNELRLDWITGTTVVSPTGEAIGDINDLILDAESFQVKAAIVGVGGFLGIGEKQIAVPFDGLTVNYDAQQITSELTEEEAEAAPEYVFRERDQAAGDMTDPAAVPMNDAATTDTTTDTTVVEEPATDATMTETPAADAPAMEENAVETEATTEAPATDATATETPEMEAEATEAEATEATEAEPAEGMAEEEPVEGETAPATN